MNKAQNPSEQKKILWSRQFVAERWSEPISPLSASLLLEKFVGEYLHYPRVSKLLCNSEFPTRIVNGHVYLNATLFQGVFESMKIPAPDFILELFPKDVQKRLTSIEKGLPDFDFVWAALKTAFKDKIFSVIDVNIIKNPQHWERFLESYLGRVKELEGVDLHTLNESELWEFYGNCEELIFRYRKIHLGSLLIGNTLYQVLGYLVKRWTDGDFVGIKASLVKGLSGDMTIQMNKCLWLLAQEIKQFPNLCRQIANSTAEEIISEKDNPHYRYFMRLLNGFLDNYGHRAHNSYELMSPSWKTNPIPVIETVQSYISDSGENNCPFDIERNQREERLEATQRVAEQLAQNALTSYLPFKSWFFKRFLNLNQVYMLLRENQRFYFDMVLTLVKHFLDETAMRARQEGRLNHPTDIYFLTIDEIRECLIEHRDFRSRIEARQVKYADALKVPPSTYLLDDEPYNDGSIETYSELSGIGVSPGIREGKVRIINYPGEFKSFRRGEILVTTGTDPGWTPLFLRAAALVTEIGGLLSHGAVVAREYGLPAVVGVPLATRKLQTGQHVMVDGLNGIVRSFPG